MRDAGPPPPIDDAGQGVGDAARPRPPGAPRYCRVDGILEGRVGSTDAAARAVAQANAARYAHLDFDVDGGRFSALPDAAVIPPDAMTDERRRAFFDGLCAFAAASDGPVESTLRCTEVFADTVRETLFLPDDAGRSLRALTRERPVTAEERAGAAKAPDAPPPMPKGRLALLAVLLVVAFGLIAWNGGWLDRAFSAHAGDLTTDTSAFGDLLAVEVTDSWGNYEVKVRRGPSYPTTTADVEKLERGAADPARRAAVRAVADGGTIWLRLENRDGKGVAAVRSDLRALVERADRAAESKLPGRMSAAKLRLAPDAATPETWPRGAVLAAGEAIAAACDGCGKPWAVHASMAGFRLRCDCGAWVAVGGSTAGALPFSDESQLPARLSRTVQLPQGPPPGEFAQVRSWDGGPLRPDADGEWSLRHASAEDRERWSNRTALELALVMLSFIGPQIAIQLGATGAQRVLWMPLASLVSSFAVLAIAGAWRGRALAGLRGADARYFAEAVAGAAALGAVAVGYSFLFMKAFPKALNEMPDARETIGLPGLLFVISFCPGVFEEIAFRGLLNARLAVLFGSRTSAWIGAAAFAFAHGITMGLPFHFGLGVWFTFLKRRSGSLVPGMVAHALYNAIIVCALSQR